MSTSILSSHDLRCVFQCMDMNGDGMVCLDELNAALEKITGMRVGVKELESMVGKAALSAEEFLCFYKTILENGDDHDQVGGREEELVEAFTVFDENGDGFISSQELESALMRLGMWEGKQRDCQSMICVYDIDCDGRLDFHEFKKMMSINTLS